MLVVFSTIFVAGTKTIFGYNFEAPLSLDKAQFIRRECEVLCREISEYKLNKFSPYLANSNEAQKMFSKSPFKKKKKNEGQFSYFSVSNRSKVT